MEEKEYDEMNDDELEQVRMRAENEYEAMKDRVHELAQENQILKNKLNNKPMDYVYIKKEDVDRWIGKHFPNKDLISIDDLIGCIEDLDSEVERLKEKYEDLEKDLEDNYRPIPISEQVGISDKDFI